jgi:putative ABC transport system permease protein
VPGLADVHINAGVLAFALGLCIATALAGGLIPAFATRTEYASSALVGLGRASVGGSARRAASVLVSAEVSLVVILLIGAGLILKSFARLAAVDPGFRTDHVLTMSIEVPAARYHDPDTLHAFYRRAFASLHALPDVREAGAALIVPLTGNNWTVSFERVDRPVPAGQQPPEVGVQHASERYFKVLVKPLLSGRFFDDHQSPHSKPVILISDAIRRRYFPFGQKTKTIRAQSQEPPWANMGQAALATVAWQGDDGNAQSVTCGCF